MVMAILDTFIMVTSVASVILLFLTNFSSLKYTRTFYGDRPIPRSWVLIMIGLLGNAIAESGELWGYADVALKQMIPSLSVGMIGLVAHMIAGISLAIGAYMLWKEIP